MRKPVLLAILSFALPLAAFAAPKSSAEADKQALLKADADFEKARSEKGLEGWLSFFADDTLDLIPGKPIVTGKDEMRKRLTPQWDKTVVLKWKPVKADVGQSGDLGYTAGTWQLTAPDKRTNKQLLLTGKYLTVWKKQKDGTWKVEADMGNQDPPPSRPPIAAPVAKPH